MRCEQGSVSRWKAWKRSLRFLLVTHLDVRGRKCDPSHIDDVMAERKYRCQSSGRNARCTCPGSFPPVTSSPNSILIVKAYSVKLALEGTSGFHRPPRTSRAECRSCHCRPWAGFPEASSRPSTPTPRCRPGPASNRIRPGPRSGSVSQQSSRMLTPRLAAATRASRMRGIR